MPKGQESTILQPRDVKSPLLYMAHRAEIEFIDTTSIDTANDQVRSLAKKLNKATSLSKGRSMTAQADSRNLPGNVFISMAFSSRSTLGTKSLPRGYNRRAFPRVGTS
jgi:hypothetical protein